MNHNDIRRGITSRIHTILSDYGLENSVSGGKYDELRQEVGPTTGYWEGRSVQSKPSRLIVSLFKSTDGICARIPRENDSGTFAYANTAKRRVGGLSVRVLPVIKLDDEEFRSYPQWEWLLWYCFWPELNHGSSGQVFDGFSPDSGTFSYMGRVQPYIAAGIVTLNDRADQFVDEQHDLMITYEDATNAIVDLIKFAPTEPSKTLRDNGGSVGA